MDNERLIKLLEAGVPIEAEDSRPAPFSAEVDELLRHFFGLSSGTVCDGIIAYMNSSDCSPRSRERIKNYFRENTEK